MSACKSCGAPILWAITASEKGRTGGKRMPVDPEPHADGNVVFTGREADGMPEVVVRGKGADGAHRSHFATCPNANQHRNPR